MNIKYTTNTADYTTGWTAATVQIPAGLERSPAPAVAQKLDLPHGALIDTPRGMFRVQRTPYFCTRRVSVALAVADAAAQA